MRKAKFLYLMIFILTLSCVKDIDVDQLDDIEILTDHNVSLIHFDLNVSNFLDDLNNEVLTLTDTTRYPIFVGPYSQNYLFQVEFNYSYSNSFDRDITFQYDLLDINGQLVYKLQPILVEKGNIGFSAVQYIFESEIPAILETDQVVVNISLDDGNIPLDELQDFIFNLKSGIILHYKITVDEE